MKHFSDKYTYTRTWFVPEGTERIEYNNTKLSSVRNGRLYSTKMDVSDLPEYYCEVERHLGIYDVIKSKDVKDIHYTWVKENHFMKDSVLRVSFTGKIKRNDDGSVSWSEYGNVDALVFDRDIFKFISYVKKYSPDVDLNPIRNEFIKQCEWLKKNEPRFAPDVDDFGEWFDNKIS